MFDEEDRLFSRIAMDRRGVALVEFALVAPALLLILSGILAYGGYFWRANAMQQVANDAARAAIAGLTRTERDALARDATNQQIASLSGIQPARVAVSVTEPAELVRVEISYDASSDPFFRLGLVPMPSPLIRRHAAVRLGGL